MLERADLCGTNEHVCQATKVRDAERSGEYPNKATGSSYAQIAVIEQDEQEQNENNHGLRQDYQPANIVEFPPTVFGPCISCPMW
jgi:hypothetical protein